MKSEFLKIAKLNPQKEQAVFENRKTMFPQIIEKKIADVKQVWKFPA